MDVRKVVLGASTVLGAASRHYLVLLVVAGAVVVLAYVSYYVTVVWMARQGIEHPKSQAYLLEVLDRLKRPPPWN